MQITADTLAELGANCNGIEAFNHIFPYGFAGDYTPDIQYQVLQTELRKYLDWFLVLNGLPQWCMIDRDFSNKDMSYTEFQGCTWNKSNFNTTMLTKSTLTRGSFVGCQLDFAKLNNCIAKYSVFAGATFCHADLSMSNFRGSNFVGCDFSGAKLDGAIFNGCSLRGSNFNGASVYDTFFINTNLRSVRNIDIVKCQYQGAIFE